MKAGRLIAATVMTAGILAVGFLAPEAVTEVMDRRLKTETAEFETESIQVESMEENHGSFCKAGKERGWK